MFMDSDDNFVPDDESDDSTDMDDNDRDIPTNMKNFQFSKTNELLQAIPRNEPIDYFRAILDDEFLDLIVIETNFYAETMFLSEDDSKNSKITRWKPATSSEMLTFIGYIKNMMHKSDIKLYMVTEPNGTISKSLVYTGALDVDIEWKGHTTQVVLDLLQNYLDSGHSVYLDNFYNSFELADKLTSRNTYYTGTLNSKRTNNPKELLAKKIKNG
ncbi:hypothetical protein NQ314_015076 [Rhamnusium bicolor]|uniref:PiggyBac transposable element-derived protein domain-containing protein n=1 Tax=Rhamnusium bicolor TaxID=1586634 RepID=A0AAV8WZP3_9CUCU|nr:hypothetical protein NQ314_015076 [Rhamnusium bicolor]